MGSLPSDGQQNQQDDIMQIARVGDVPAMEKLFESGEYDATYSDDEGITPLHVSRDDEGVLSHRGLTYCSGQPLITSMRCANSLSNMAPRSTERAASPSQHLYNGQLSELITTPLTSSSNMELTP